MYVRVVHNVHYARMFLTIIEVVQICNCTCQLPSHLTFNLFISIIFPSYPVEPVYFSLDIVLEICDKQGISASACVIFDRSVTSSVSEITNV